MKAVIPKKYLIIWEKWHDFLNPEEDINTSHIDEEETNRYNINNTYHDMYDEDHEDVALKTIKAQNFKNQMKLIITPLGVVPLTEESYPNKVFKFWVGHTTFDITPIIYKLIEKTPGVEILNIFTRYRFRIGIGQAFDDGKTMRKINTNINDFLFPKNQKSDPNKIKQDTVFNIYKDRDKGMDNDRSNDDTIKT